MKALLISIDSKFIHSNLALRYLKSYCEKSFDVEIKEFTINQKIEYVVGEILDTECDILCFSCYIWNIEYIKEIIYIIKTAAPNKQIMLGGPEVSYNVHEILQNNQYVDYIIFGEGEKSFYDFLKAFDENSDKSKVKGLAYRENGNIIVNENRELIKTLDELSFPYNTNDSFKDKIVYYESSRGCPFRCAFCMSSIDKSVRFLSMDRVKSDLKFLLNSDARQIKFVDRTFNADYRRAMEIMQFIVDNNNGNTGIHFEITADIINEEFLDFLKTMPVNMFQFEIGIQSMNEETLCAINRKTNLDKLKYVIARIKENKNIHMHVDLIAGLPFENYDTFKKSFNIVHDMYADKLQLGFLKVLKGTKIYEDTEIHDIKYNTKAPYEIINNQYISYKELLKLKNIEELVDRYYNERYFDTTLPQIINYYNNDAFAFYEDFSDYWKEKDLYNSMHSRKELYKILYEFISCKEFYSENLKNILMYDFLCSNEKEELISIFDKKCEEDFRILKRNIARNEDFRNKYFPDIDKATKIINSFRIAKINEKIILFIYNDKKNVFNRCETYDISDEIHNYQNNQIDNTHN